MRLLYTFSHKKTRTNAAELKAGVAGRGRECRLCFIKHWTEKFSKQLASFNWRNNGSAKLKGQRQTKTCVIFRWLPWKCGCLHASCWMEFYFPQWDNGSRFRLEKAECAARWVLQVSSKLFFLPQLEVMGIKLANVHLRNSQISTS